jgi:hypothetical protein
VRVRDLHIEKHEYEGRKYTVVGNLIFEFNRVMHRGWGDPTESLKRCLANLKIQRGQAIFTAIATDGLSFHVYKPQFDEAGLVVEMEAIDGLNLASPMMTPERAQQDLGHILSHLQN